MTVPPRRRTASCSRGAALAATAVPAVLGTTAAGTTAPAAAAAGGTEIGAVTGFSRSGAVYTFTAGAAKARVSFVSADTFRIEAAPDGTFTDPVGDDVVVPQS